MINKETPRAIALRKLIKKTVTGALVGVMLVASCATGKADAINKNTCYSPELAIELQDAQIDRIYRNNKKAHPGISKYEIKRAFISARNRMPKKYCTMKDYYTRVALILATMETESDFRKINHRNSNGSIDYGVMQVNSSVIPTIKKALGSKVTYLKTRTSHNIEAGSYEIISLCYNKAKKKHSGNTIWWTYAYYNRGLYFENTYGWKHNRSAIYKQANARSKIFINKYNRYYKDLR